METPRTMKDIYSLNGKLAALSQFLAKSGEQKLPFFQALKMHMRKKDITWSNEAEEAF